MNHVVVDGYRLEYRDIPGARPDRPPILMLHEGLGCVAMWRDFPEQVVATTGCRVIVWSRAGYGASTPYAAPRQSDYMHREALTALPALRQELGLDEVILFGHSDGGSIALIHAGQFPGGVRGVAVMAPHEFVEEITLAGVRDARQVWETTDFPEKLARYHADADRVFHDWNDTWLSPAFRDWNIEAFLDGIACPVLAMQGEDDEYATMRQIDAIAQRVRGCSLVKIQECGHSPHRDQPEKVLQALSEFVESLPSA